ncbi:hypothetical protein [Algibacter luteus]|uniref:hypothetical protein n=1 Tax=Algibacter luteus TaxID=1178825 RepID=UPI002593D0C2|nr:hypothetical protein [Algibacter luteus]WJJ96585.1 hypothetical protein O5O44_15330 [Algibacter luteus]
MRQTIFNLITLLFSSILFSQVTTNDNFQIKFQKARQVDNSSIMQSSQLKIKSSDLIKTMVKIKIKSKEKDRLNLSAFSLRDINNKIRYRLADYKGYAGVVGFPEYVPYLKTKLFDKKGKELRNVPEFDPEQKDLFNDFNVEDYQNFEVPVNFGNEQYPNLSIVYFGTTTYKNFTAELFFGILVENKDADYVLYYKNEKISKIELKLR